MSHKRSKKVAKKKANKVKEPKPKSMDELYPVRSLFQTEADQFKALTVLSSNRAAIIKDIEDKETGMRQMRALSKQLRHGDIKGPLMQQILPGVFAQFPDTKKAATKIDEQIKIVQTAVDIAKGQISHRYEEYVDALINYRDRFSEIIGDAKRSNIAVQRLGAKEKDEKVVFEKTFDDFEKNACKCKSCKITKKTK